MNAKPIIEEINSVQRRVRVTVPREDVNKAFAAHFQRLRGKAKISGFRPGKAPLSLVKKMYGQSGSYDIVDQLVRQHLLSAIRETGVKAISQPYVETTELPIEDQSFEITAIVDVFPGIQLQGWDKKLEIQCEHYTADEHALEHRLEGLARSHARAVKLGAEAACENGQLAKISYYGQIDGVTDPNLTLHEQMIEVGKQPLLSKELDAALLGMHAGETKQVQTTFQGENIVEKYRNKTVHFSLTLIELHKLELPKIDDDFAKDLNLSSVDELKEKVKKDIEQSYERMNQDALHNALLKELIAKVSFEVPPSITDQVIDHMISQMRAKNEAELKKAMADQALRSRILPEAKLRAKNTLLLHEIVRQEKFTISDDEVKEKIRSMIDSKDPVLVERELARDFKEHGENLREQLLMNKALNYLLSHAKVQQIPAQHKHSHHHDDDGHDHHHEHHEHGPDCDHDH